MNIFVNASNTNAGGAEIILNDFISATKFFNPIKFIIYIDSRFDVQELERNNVSFTITKKSKRFLVCFDIEKNLENFEIFLILHV